MDLKRSKNTDLLKEVLWLRGEYVDVIPFLKVVTILFHESEIKYLSFIHEIIKLEVKWEYY